MFMSPNIILTDMKGVDWAVNFVMDIVREEEQKHGIPPDRMMVGGFSQGHSACIV